MTTVQVERTGTGTIRPLLRDDATWDHLVYAGASQMEDRGCKYHPSCLTCPFAVCRFEPAGNVVAVLHEDLSRQARELRQAGRDVNSIAEALGRGRRQVFRLLAG